MKRRFAASTPPSPCYTTVVLSYRCPVIAPCPSLPAPSHLGVDSGSTSDDRGLKPSTAVRDHRKFCATSWHEPHDLPAANRDLKQSHHTCRSLRARAQALQQYSHKDLRRAGVDRGETGICAKMLEDKYVNLPATLSSDA